jgi:hypothetical protein
VPGQFPSFFGHDINCLECSFGDQQPGCGTPDDWFGPEFCNRLGWPQFSGCPETFPRGYGCYMTDASQNAVAWANTAGGGSAEGQRTPANISAQQYLSGRNFWFFLDEDGFPSGAHQVFPPGVGVSYAGGAGEEGGGAPA